MRLFSFPLEDAQLDETDFLNIQNFEAKPRSNAEIKL